MRALRIDAAAELDLDAIYEQGLRQFGMIQADSYLDELYNQFELLADFPGIGTAVRSTTFPEAKSFGLGSHIILYTFDETSLTINRVFHGRSNFAKYL